VRGCEGAEITVVIAVHLSVNYLSDDGGLLAIAVQKSITDQAANSGFEFDKDSK
jgi:hypothetical protein